MPDRFDDEPQGGPSLPPIVGTDPSGWLDDATIQAALARPAWAGDDGQPYNNPFATMNINQYLGLPSEQQRTILGQLSGSTPQVWDPNSPHTAPDLVSKLWYAAPETSRAAYLDAQARPNTADISFTAAMLGPGVQATTQKGVVGDPIPAIPFGQGRWEERHIPQFRDPVWRFNRLPRATLEGLAVQGRLPTELEPAPIFGQMAPARPRPQNAAEWRKARGLE
jgi:hypothetical protein